MDVRAERLTRNSVRTGEYVAIPDECHRFEVPYGLNIEVPAAARAWGLTLTRAPCRDQDAAWQSLAVRHAAWCAFFTQ